MRNSENEPVAERERNATIIEIHTIRGKGHNKPYIFIMRKLFTTFGSSEFLDTGPNGVLCGAAGALNLGPGKIHMEQGCHLAAALQKRCPPSAQPDSENPQRKRQTIKLSLLLEIGERNESR